MGHRGSALMVPQLEHNDKDGITESVHGGTLAQSGIGDVAL